MALSPNDFYAYSRATGTPYPEDAEERARIAPQVLDFRRNQLRAPVQEEEQGSGLANALGIGAALAGIGTAGFFGLRRALSPGARKTAPTPPPMPETVERAQKAASESDFGAVGSLVRPLSAPPSKRPPTTPTVVDNPALEAEATQFIEELQDEQREIDKENRFQSRIVQGIESKDKAQAKNMLANMRRETAQSQFSPRNYVESTGSLAPANDLTSIQEGQDAVVVKQQVEAVDSGLDQVVLNDSVIPDQRVVSPLTSFLRDQENVVRNAKLQQKLENFPQELSNVAAVSPKRPIVSDNIWEIEDQLEELRRQSLAEQAARYQRGGRTIVDLTGEVEISPQAARQARKEGLNVRGNRYLQLSQFSESAAKEGIGVNRFTPGEILERTMAAVSYPREIRDVILNPNVPREQIAKYLGTTPQVRGGAVSINPTMEVAGGARASMPGAGMEEIQTAGVGGTGLTYHDTTDLKQLQQNEQLERAGFVYDPNTGNYYSEFDDLEIDPTELMTAVSKNATDYGDTEGVGNLLIETETFKERTNEGTTQIPGAVQQMFGKAPGSERQERFADVVIPLRRDASNVQTAGIDIVSDPEQSFARQLRLQDRGYREFGSRMTSEDLSAQGPRLTGGYEEAVSNVPDTISTVPVSEWRENGGLIRGEDGRLYSAVGREIIGEEPLVGVKRTPLVEVDSVTKQPKRVGFTTLATAKPQQITLSRNALQEVVENAKNTYFNNPSAKARYLQERNPSVLEAGRASGKTLADIGEAYDYQGFIANELDNYLMNVEGIDLPLLKPQVDSATGNLYLSKEANAFVTNLLKTSKDSPIYGKRFIVDKEGRRVPKRNDLGQIVTNKGGYIVYETEDVARPIPGKYETQGGGGVDPMTIGDDYEGGNVSFYTPRINTGSQRKLMGTAKTLGIPAEGMLGIGVRTAGELSTPLQAGTQTGAIMSALRNQMSTPQSGVGMRSVPVRDPATGNRLGTQRVSTMNIGSFARTQNPYTGPAAPAMGPASRVLLGNYQYTDPQLTVRLEPTSTKQLQERNQFAYTANVTPGGRVARGALNLGQGQGAIPAGVGALSESETINRYGVAGSQLQEVGNRLMAQAAYKKGLQPMPTTVSAVDKTPVPGGTTQPVLPGIMEGSPMAPRGYTPNNALDFYTRALEQEAAQLAQQQPQQRMVRRQGRMVPLEQATTPYQRNVFFQRG